MTKIEIEKIYIDDYNNLVVLITTKFTNITEKDVCKCIASIYEIEEDKLNQYWDDSNLRNKIRTGRTCLQWYVNKLNIDVVKQRNKLGN